MELDPVILSRIQFAFVISFHIIFPAFTIGLAAWLATIEGARLASGNMLSRALRRTGTARSPRSAAASARWKTGSAPRWWTAAASPCH